MAMVKAAALVVAVAAVLGQLAAAAVVHKVGGNGNWDASGGYDAWSATQKFAPGDSVAFTYETSHDVVEVNEAGYKTCSATGPIASYTGGSTTVKLTAPGKRYFICAIPGHCKAGMKLAVNVAATAAPGAKPRGQRSVAPTTAPAPAPEASASTDELPTASSPTGAPAPKASGAASTKAGVALLAMGMALALAMWGI